MTFRVNTNSLKNAMGTMFLLVAAFFVCSTVVSMRSVFADPVAPANTLPGRSGRVSPRASIENRAVAARAAVAQNQTASRTTAARGSSVNRIVTSRNKVASRPTSATTASSRGVTARNKIVNNTTRSNRAVRARTSATPSRVSATGTVMAGNRASTLTSYSYLASSLYTGSYSNIVDSSTGLISADAYSNCMESYYTCMDEICTARSDTKGRCSCAGRATNFLAAETSLEKANEELIKLSGQLSLLIATKGKGDDLASAFSLTDAEKVMNCVSYKEATDKQAWCDEHPTFTDSGTSATCAMPSYCTSNDFGFNIKNIDGSSSDILAQLKAWADAKDLAKEYTISDNDGLLNKYTTISGVVNGLVGITDSSNLDEASLDSLANKWGYKLFEYAHNNVCGRVLDSCFNGIYEACGTPVSVTDSDGKSHTKCANGATSNCPFNYNSYISVVTSGDNQGDVKLNERNSGSTTTTSTAACFGYTTTSTVSTRTGTATTTDPYGTLRGPVADARRSIMQKYLLDANAACDVYGTALKQTAQNINYQKIAAEQALQQKRLEFKQEEEASVLASATTAIDNFNECISEIWDCYEDYADEDKWTTARIKAYCSQVSQVPHCYEPMICAPLKSQYVAVIDKPDVSSCKMVKNEGDIYDYRQDTCRNVVTISEILYGTGASPVANATSGNSAGIREACLQEALNCGTGASYSDEGGCLRNWEKDKTYNIVYYVDGAQISLSPATYSVSQTGQTISLPTTGINCPNNKLFRGWCEGISCANNSSVVMDFTVSGKGSKQFTAKCE